MAIDESHARLQDIAFGDVLGYVGVTSRDIVRTIRGIQGDVRKLAAAAFHHQRSIKALEEWMIQVEARIARAAAMLDTLPQPTMAPKPAKVERAVQRPTDLRVRHSVEPCVDCDRRWSEPTKRGRMSTRCPDCR